MKSGERWLKSKEKRSFDILFSTTASTLALPLGLTAMVALAVENRQNPFFCQKRVGNPDRELWVPKLRTLAGPVEHLPSAKGHDHERAAGMFSSLVRRTHIDETPQFALVMRGGMSVVGPRPIVKPEFDEIMDNLSPSEQDEWRAARRACKPGLVNALSPAQHVDGYENNPRLVAESDITYVQTASRKEDRRIIIATARAVIADLF